MHFFLWSEVWPITFREAAQDLLLHPFKSVKSCKQYLGINFLIPPFGREQNRALDYEYFIAISVGEDPEVVARMLLLEILPCNGLRELAW